MLRPLLASLLLTALAVGPARAQDDASPEDVEVARDLFRSGMEASRENRWNEARLSFQRSYDLVPRASTLLNLAAAEVEVGAMVSAADHYRAFLELPDEGRASEYREAAEAALADAESRIARVTLTIEGLRPDDVIEINGAPRPQIEGPLPMDPGANRVIVRRDGERIGELDLNLVEGEERGVSLPLRVAAPALATGPMAPAPDDGEPSIIENPWLWVGAGTLVLVGVIVGVAAGVAASGEAPYVGNLGPGMVVFE